MDIQFQSSSSVKRYLLIAIAVLCALLIIYIVLKPSRPSFDISELTLTTAQQGPLDIYVDSFGEFISHEERLLTAPARGKVSEILHRPGAVVSPETIIVRLINPQLVQDVNQATGALSQTEAQLAAFKFEQESARLNHLGSIEELKATLEQAQLELSVNKQLLSFGTVSKIKLQRAKLAVKQSQSSLEFEQKKYQQFIEMQGHQLTQKRIEVEQQQRKLNVLNEQLGNMNIRAGLNGTLQNLDIALGESVSLGQSIAKVGSLDKLIARIRLPQRQADQINLGAKVVIDTQKGKIAAHITRIESVVTDGSVLAEATLDGELTPNARPSLTISAKVFVEHQSQAIHIKQSAGFRPSTKQTLFVLANNQLEQRKVTFGHLTKNQLIIDDGLQAGEIIVANDMRDFHHFSTLELVQ
ncbi:MAG: RND transporter [Gammaproteobacteria bacterium MedPE]|nr:MAG: RND transporter [Gammaproteobacteria bacterium MedPE]